MLAPWHLVRRYPLVSFLVLACLFGWSLFLAAALGLGSDPDNLPLGPLAAAAIVTAGQGRAVLRDWARRLIGWAASPWLYAVAVLVPIAVHVGIVVINSGFGAPLPTAEQWSTWPQIPLNFVIMLVMVGLGEEAGWSAFAAPLLRRRHSLIISWLLLSAMRIAWHLPLMITGALPWSVGILGNAGFQLILLVLFEMRGWRWTVAAVWHATLNAFGGGFFFGLVTGADQARLGLLLALAYALLGAVSYLAYRLYSRRQSDDLDAPAPVQPSLAGWASDRAR